MIIYTNKNTNKKRGKLKNRMGRVRNTKSLNLSYGTGLVLYFWTIWDRIEKLWGGGGGRKVWCQNSSDFPAPDDYAVSCERKNCGNVNEI